MLSLIDLVRQHSVSEPKRLGFDFAIEDIEADLAKLGKHPHRSTIYKALKGMGLKPNRRGYYEAPQVAVLLDWYTNPNTYPSYASYIKLAGQALYDAVRVYYQETTV